MNNSPILFFGRLSDYVHVACRSLACLLLGLVALSATTQVIGRNLFGFSPHWLEEMMRYSFIWITSIGAAMLVKTNGHAVIDVLVMKLTGKYREAHQIMVFMAVLACAVVLVTQGWQIMTVVHQQLSPSMRLPMSFVYAALPVGGVAMGIHCLHAILHQLQHSGRQSRGVR